MTRVLVTGGAGFIGSHTVDLLLERGYDVRILDTLAPPVHPEGQAPDYLPAEAELMVGDVRDRSAWEQALAGVDSVIHLAAYQDYLPDFSKFAVVNDGGTALLYEVIVAGRLPVRKVVVASSQAGYGEGKYRCPEHGVRYPHPRSSAQLERREWELRCAHCGQEMELLATDEDRMNPHNQYAVSKYAQELYALALGRRWDIPSVALRYSITQGPRQSFRNAYSGVCRIFTTQLLADRRPIAYEDGLQRRDYIHIADVGRANLLALEDDRATFRSFNVGGDRSVTVLDYARLLARTIGKEIEPELPGLYRVGDSRHIISDVSALKALGWRPRESLERIAEDYVSWAQRQPDLADYTLAAEQFMLKMGALRRVGEWRPR